MLEPLTDLLASDGIMLMSLSDVSVFQDLVFARLKTGLTIPLIPLCPSLAMARQKTGAAGSKRAVLATSSCHTLPMAQRDGPVRSLSADGHRQARHSHSWRK